jgi:AmmeMemoRadiSam system protein B
MKTRKPIVAGQFYPADRSSCIEEINECLAARTLPKSLPKEIVAGIVPHAGWMFSGSLAAMVFSAVKQRHPDVHTFVIFGAAHGYYGDRPVLDDSNFWETPLGKAGIDEMLSNYLIEKRIALHDSLSHKGEHSIEVQVPFIQHLFPKAQILPIIVPPNKQAIALGEALGGKELYGGKIIVYIGSTDLTHYGPRYGFTPMGLSRNGLDWAAKVNDKQFIDTALKLDPEGILAGAAENLNACGAGAAAAAVAVAKKTGKTEGMLLAQTNSNEVMQRKMGAYSQDSVGYAAILF